MELGLILSISCNDPFPKYDVIVKKPIISISNIGYKCQRPHVGFEFGYFLFNETSSKPPNWMKSGPESP